MTYKLLLFTKLHHHVSCMLVSWWETRLYNARILLTAHYPFKNTMNFITDIITIPNKIYVLFSIQTYCRCFVINRTCTCAAILLDIECFPLHTNVPRVNRLQLCEISIKLWNYLNKISRTELYQCMKVCWNWHIVKTVMKRWFQKRSKSRNQNFSEARNWFLKEIFVEANHIHPHMLQL